MNSWNYFSNSLTISKQQMHLQHSNDRCNHVKDGDSLSRGHSEHILDLHR